MNGNMLEKTLIENKVDISLCKRLSVPSGMGLVFLQDDGAVSCIVCSGANGAWDQIDARKFDDILTSDTKCILLQMEIPMFVNEIIAKEAHNRGIPVFQVTFDAYSMLNYFLPYLVMKPLETKAALKTELCISI